jgi:dTDP-4-amino-4,6-dideoxygalactose transaminase
VICARDDVNVPTCIFSATANAVLYTVARPIFVDIDPLTYNIDTAAINAAITPRTKAIVPVDQIGLAADLDAVLEIAERYRLRVIEDAAPALGATYRGRTVGAISPVTCFSSTRQVHHDRRGWGYRDHDELAARARVLPRTASVSDLARHSATRSSLRRVRGVWL